MCRQSESEDGIVKMGNVRQETLIKSCLRKFAAYSVHGFQSLHVHEDDRVRINADDRPILLDEFINGAAPT